MTDYSELRAAAAHSEVDGMQRAAVTVLKADLRALLADLDAARKERAFDDAHIAELRAELEAVKAERDAARNDSDLFGKQSDEHEAAAHALRAENERLRKVYDEAHGILAAVDHIGSTVYDWQRIVPEKAESLRMAIVACDRLAPAQERA